MSRRRSATLDLAALSGGRGKGGRGPTRWGSAVWAVIDCALALLAGSALASTVLGAWIGAYGAYPAGWLLGHAPTVLDGPVVNPAYMVSVLVVVMVILAVWDLTDLTANAVAIACFLLVGSVALAGEGWPADGIKWVTEHVQHLSHQLLSNMFGG